MPLSRWDSGFEVYLRRLWSNAKISPRSLIVLIQLGHVIQIFKSQQNRGCQQNISHVIGVGQVSFPSVPAAPEIPDAAYVETRVPRNKISTDSSCTDVNADTQAAWECSNIIPPPSPRIAASLPTAGLN